MKHALLSRGRLLAVLMILLATLFAAAAVSGPASADVGPAITGVAPAYGAPSGGTQVTITGSGFTGAVSVTFGGTAALFSVASDTQITATSPPGTGTVPVTVTTPSGSASAQFIYTPIQHVVVIYEENHSFDNLIGYWCNDHPGRCPDGGMPATVTLSDGTVVTPSTDPDVVPQVDHSTSGQVKAIDGGKMDGWQLVSGCTAAQNYACVSGYQPWQEPNLTTLAEYFAMSDDTFSMQDSPSWFGHMYIVAASTDGFTGNNPPIAAKPGVGWGCDSGKKAAWAPSPGAPTQQVPSCVPDPALTGPGGHSLANGGASKPTPVPYIPTIMDRLNAANPPLTWKLYGAQCASEKVVASGLETCVKLPASEQSLSYGWAVCPSFAECLYSQSSGMASYALFAADAKAGNLPAFSVLTPGNFIDSEHNGFSMAQGDNWLGQQVQAVMNGPDWASTAIFITYDDCGCFYDQAVPGINPDGTPQGPRVPLVIVSPYARPDYTDTTPATFASILAYTEDNFGLAPLGVNDAGAYNFSGAFDYGQTPLRKVHIVTRPVPKGDKIDWAQAREDS